MVTISIQSLEAINHQATKDKAAELIKAGHKLRDIRPQLEFIHNDIEGIKYEFNRMLNQVSFKIDLDNMLQKHSLQRV